MNSIQCRNSHPSGCFLASLPGKNQQHYSTSDQEKRKKRPAAEPKKQRAAVVAENIRLTEPFAKNPHRGVGDQELRSQPGGLLFHDLAPPETPLHQDKKQQSFQGRFIQLRRMTRRVAGRGARKDHRPRHIRWPAPEFAVQEIGHTTEEQARAARRTPPDLRCGRHSPCAGGQTRPLQS